MDMTGGILGVLILLLLGAIVSTLLARRRTACAWVSFVWIAAAAVWVGAIAVEGLMGRPAAPGPELFQIPALNTALVFGVDPLSSVFLLVIALLAAVSALYSVGYITHPHYERESLTRYYPFLFVFLMGMIGVVVSWDLFLFLVFWEVMTLASYFLVVFESGNPTSLKAGFKYFVMTHIATACLIAAFLVLRLRGGGFGFEEGRAGLTSLEGAKPLLLHGALLMMFVGFGTKAAIFPLGDWLPDAHPAAPSPISCLLSGVMIKLGVYGLLRVFFWMAPSAHTYTIWGGIIAFFGAVSLFVGTMEALAQHDSKRLLAFHSMGQMGYIFLGIGIGIAFLRVSPALSAAGFIGGIYHLVNHACFKGLLFLNAGSALIRGGTREIDGLGGLARFMPWTAATAIIASFAIAGVPPMNGFGSKWMIYQASLFSGLQSPVFLLYGVAAIFISAVTLASFVKFLGAIFYGQPSVNVTRRASEGLAEVPGSMGVAQGVLAVACVVFGVIPWLVVSSAHRAIAAARPELFPPFASLFSGRLMGININIGEGPTGNWNAIPILLAFAACLLVPWLIYRSARSKVRAVTPWSCGEEHRPDEIRHAAGGYYGTFRSLTAPVVGRWRAAGFYPRWPHMRAPALAAIRPVFDFDFVYRSVVGALMKTFGWFSHVQVGYPQVYVLWMAAGLVVAMVLLFTLP
jgi:hydrogenase-4 component B